MCVGDWSSDVCSSDLIANLRKKLEEAWGDHMFIQTVWGKGYKFVEPPVSG